MSFGHWVVRVSLLLNVTLIITILTIFDPSVLQTAANDAFGSYLHTPDQQLWALYGIVFGVATLLTLVSIKSIGDAREASLS